MQDRVHDLAEGLPLERQPAGQHLVEHHAQREQVRARIGGPPERLLRRHVGHRAEHRPGHRVVGDGDGDIRRSVLPRLHELRQAEVEHFHLAARVDDDVGALDVAMNDAAAVCLDQRVPDLPRDVHRVADRQRPAGGARREHVAFDVLHDEEVGALVFADVVDRGDVRRAQRRGRPGFGEKARPPLGVGPLRRGQELERDVTAKARVFGTVDLAHAASAEALAYPIVLNGGSDHFTDLSSAAFSIASAAGESGQTGSGGAVYSACARRRSTRAMADDRKASRVASRASR